MKGTRKSGIFILGLLIWMMSASAVHRLDYRTAMHRNVCKDLKDDVLVYFVFVDTKTTSPWTEFDINSTLDSIQTALKWLEQKARENNILLTFKTGYYMGDTYSTISKNLPEGSVEATALSPTLRKGIPKLNSWADYIARKAGASFYIPEKDGIPAIKPPRNKERLVALLRDQFQVESVALLYLVNNYYRTDISLPVNIFSSEDVEFSIISYKYTSEFAHNILHLFGAADLYKTPYRRSTRAIQLAAKEFPDDIMQDPYARNLDDLEIGEFTRYLIGWNDAVDSKYEKLFLDRWISY